jgi:wyosine [tRNA(Phe)-imidazoG37] synthetase (radical SAM superfamily)
MATFLFDEIIFGPVWSRRLGESLGINLLPQGRKVCNFNCIYCECGITAFENQPSGFPPAAELTRLLEQKLDEIQKNSTYLNSITFAGNGEPTLHPEFSKIIDAVIEIRNRKCPGVTIAVLSNATLIPHPDIFNTLKKVDLNILKLDSAIEETLMDINCPHGKFNLDDIMAVMKNFKGKLIIQSLFLKGYCNGKFIDNTTDSEIEAWIRAIEAIKPESVMLYSLARDTAMNNLEKVSEDELNRIAALLNEKEIKTQVTP